MLLVVDTGFVD